MDIALVIELVLFAVLMLLSGFFSSSETNQVCNELTTLDRALNLVTTTPSQSAILTSGIATNGIVGKNSP